jgi:hypothetical protein
MSTDTDHNDEYPVSPFEILTAEQRLRKFVRVEEWLRTVNLTDGRTLSDALLLRNIDVSTPNAQFVVRPDIHTYTTTLIVLLNTSRRVDPTLLVSFFMNLVCIYQSVLTMSQEESQENRVARQKMYEGIRNTLSLFAIFGDVDRDLAFVTSLFTLFRTRSPATNDKIARALLVLRNIYANNEPPRKTLPQMIESDDQLKALFPSLTAPELLAYEEAPIPPNVEYTTCVKAVAEIMCVKAEAPSTKRLIF